MAKYMLIEVSVHGIDLPHDEVLARVKKAVEQELDDQPFLGVEVECDEHAGEG
jgi:hypothetical protein